MTSKNTQPRRVNTSIRLCDTGQQIPCFDSCQLTKLWMCNIRLQAATLARCVRFHIGCLWCGRMDGQTDVWSSDVWSIHRMDRRPNYLSYGAPLARPWSSAITCGCANRGNEQKPGHEEKNENYLDPTQAES